ncbi:hypothetical protein RUND412_010318 [Rhizina undulata]
MAEEAVLNGTNGILSEDPAFPALAAAPISEPVEAAPVAASAEPAAEPTAEPSGELSQAELLLKEHELAASKNDELEVVAAEQKPGKKKKFAQAFLDVSSADAFPSLGSGTRKSLAVPQWGAKMPVSGAAPAAGTNEGVEPAVAHAPNSWAGKPAHGRNVGQLTLEMPANKKRPSAELRKPVPEIVKEIMKKTGATIESQTIKSGTTIFLISGHEDSRNLARKEIFRELSVRSTKTLNIPAIVRPHVIGKGGSKVQEIESASGTKIKVPQSTQDVTTVGEFDDEATIEVTIDGDENGIAVAIEKIMAIVGERTIKVTLRMSDVEGKFYPFIRGAHSKNIEKLEERDVKVTVPYYLFSESSTSFSPAIEPIVVYGEKQAVLETKKDIEQLIEELKAADLQQVEANVPKSKHQFFTENKAELIHEVLEETGCTVILPAGAKADKAIIFGPVDKIGAGLGFVLKKASRIYSHAIDICRVYQKVHARDLTRYFILKGSLNEIKARHEVKFTYPPPEELYDLEKKVCTISIFGKTPEAVKSAQADLIKLLECYKPHKLARVDIEPLHHRVIQRTTGRALKSVNSEIPVELLFPEDEKDPEIILVYRGESEAAEEIAAALKSAEEYIKLLIEDQPPIAEKVLEVSQDLHDKIRGERGTTLNALNPSSVLIRFGLPKARPGKPAPKASSEDSITLRGPGSNVEATAKNIQQFLKDNEGVEPKAITLNFDYPKEFSGSLIGSKGANINKLRDLLGVDININDGKGEIKGLEVTAEAARRKLKAQITELEDKAVVHVKIPQQYHSSIIGASGYNVKTLEKKYNIRINFPKAPSKSNKDAGSDAASEAGSMDKFASDEIVLKGPKKDVASAREEILDLYKYELENNVTDTITLATKSVAFMFKNYSRDIKKLRDEIAARIDIPQEDKSADPETKVTIKIRGNKKDVEHAKSVLSKIVKEAEHTTTRTISVEKKYHRSLIGPGGQTLKEIVVNAGGPEDRNLLARIVRFPNQDSTSDEIIVQGKSSVVDKIIAAIEKIVSQKQNEVSTVVEIPPEKHGKLIGREGSVRKELEARFKVVIDIPRQRQGQTPTAGIKITGSEEAVKQAEEHIQELVKEPEGETVLVPRRLHHAVADGGLFIRQLSNNYKVAIDHNGQTRPTRPQEPKPKVDGNLPLITDADQEGDSQKFSWAVEENSQIEEEGDFPWVIRGTPEAIAQAKVELEKAIDTAEKQNSIGYLILPDPRKYRFVVGPGGAQVDKIRRDTGCRITVPRNQAAGEAIVMHGSKEGLEKAKDIILELVKNSGNGNGGDRRRHRN